MQEILWGVVLIAIGLVFGGSVFLGDFGLISVFFDGLGVVFIIRGVLRVVRTKRGTSTPPAPPG